MLCSERFEELTGHVCRPQTVTTLNIDGQPRNGRIHLALAFVGQFCTAGTWWVLCAGLGLPRASAC